MYTLFLPLLEVQARKRYISPRTREVDVPVIMTQVWVRELQLMQEPKGRDADFLKDLLRGLADLVEAEEHVLEFQVSLICLITASIP